MGSESQLSMKAKLAHRWIQDQEVLPVKFNSLSLNKRVKAQDERRKIQPLLNILTPSIK